MPLIDIVRDVAIQVGLSPPSVAASSTEQTDIELVYVANRALADSRRWHDWTALAVAGSITGDGTTTSWPTPDGFDRLGSGQRVQRQGDLCYWLYGPLNASQRNDWTAQNIVRLYEVFWFRGGKIVIDPALASGRVVVFEFQSKNAVRPASGADKAKFDQDNDTCLLDEELITLCAVWRWKRMKGLDYTQEYEDWRQAAQISAARDGNLQPSAAGPSSYDLPDPVMPDTIVVS